jgi:hypothetical protein
MLDFIKSVFRPSQPKRNQVSINADLLEPLLDLLPLVFLCISIDDAADILTGLTHFNLKCHAHSSSKQKSHTFITSLVHHHHLHRHTQSQNAAIFTHVNVAKSLQQWLTSLPRYLWDLKDSDISASLSILKLMNRMLQSYPASSLLTQDTIQSWRKTMVVFFYTRVEKGGRCVDVYGPMACMPPLGKRLAESIVVGLPENESLLIAMEKALEKQKNNS